jgi:rfaE bifunctional protein nucleotidyltransferase chain/domain
MIKGWVNGCYDFLHFGHFMILNFARSKCDYLMVAIDSDSRIKQMKGNDRPHYNEIERMFMLTCIRGIEKVQVFNSDEDLEERIKRYSPDIMVVGSDWKGKKIIGAEYAKEVFYFDRIPGYSTTELLNPKSP